MAILTLEQIENYVFDPPIEVFFATLHHVFAVENRTVAMTTYSQLLKEWYPDLDETCGFYGNDRDAMGNSGTYRKAIVAKIGLLAIHNYMLWCTNNGVQQYFTAAVERYP